MTLSRNKPKPQTCSQSIYFLWFYCFRGQHHKFRHPKLKTSQFHSWISFLPHQIPNYLWTPKNFSLGFPTLHLYLQYLSSGTQNFSHRLLHIFVTPRVSTLTHICSCVLLPYHIIKLKWRNLIECLVHRKYSVNICWTKQNWGKTYSIYLRRLWGLPLRMKTHFDSLVPNCILLPFFFFNWSIVHTH